MKNLKKYALVLLLAAPLATGMKKRRYEPIPEPVVSASPSVRPSPSARPSPKVSILPIPAPVGRGYIKFPPVNYYTTAAERLKIAAVEIKVNEVFQSDCYANFMRARRLIQTDGRTPAEVVTHIQGLRKTVPVNMYYRRMGGIGGTSAVAYRNEGAPDIYMNRAYFSTSMSVCEWSSTIAHEGLHSAGEYGHDYEWSPSRSYSVPYSTGGADKAQGGSAFDKCCR